MQNLNRFRLIIILAVLTLPTAANAESWICEQGTLVREINIERETANTVPCSVKYDKQAEGLGSSVLWTAAADGAYCDAKADGLAEKLNGLGWACTAF
ncbi:MAG: hypothetical protein GY875_22050 [Gammaproteobacteria bacterium]|nr:hypothetical protein [Gammaproteobacteria bacterium]